MNITYIGHSGFLVETKRHYLLFDYDTGELPVFLPEKKLTVFVSHSHRDHYNQAIYDLQEIYRDGPEHITYVLSKEIRKKHAEEYLRSGNEMLFVKAHESCLLYDGEIKIETLKSTDSGVAFVVTVYDTPLGVTVYDAPPDGTVYDALLDGTIYDASSDEIGSRASEQGKPGQDEPEKGESGQNEPGQIPEAVLYHAGDLNLWKIEDGTKAYNNNMEANFRREMERIRGRKFDAAFVPLDPRLGSFTYDGMDIFLETVKADKVFPMHFWDQPEIIREYLKVRPNVKNVVMLEEKKVIEL